VLPVDKRCDTVIDKAKSAAPHNHVAALQSDTPRTTDAIITAE